MIIAGATKGFVGLRDHIANSFLDFSTDRAADCFVTSGEVMMGDDSSGDGVEGTSGGCGTGSGVGTGSDAGSDVNSDKGSDTDSDTGSGTGSVAGSGVGSRADSKTGSGVGSETGSDISSMLWVEGAGCGVAVACGGKWFSPESCLGSGESGSVAHER